MEGITAFLHPTGIPIVDVSNTLAADDVFDVSVNPDKSEPDGSWTRLVKT